VEGQEAVMGAEKVAEEELLVEPLMLPVVLVLSVLMVAGVVLLPGALGVVVMVVSLELHCSTHGEPHGTNQTETKDNLPR